MPWYRGNTHTHTNVSDGDSPIVEVAAWYEKNGYDFLAITDHFRVSDPEKTKRLQTDKFIMIAGQEISDTVGGGHFDINVYGTTKRIEAATGPTKVEQIQNNMDLIRSEGGIPCLNHPNFWYAVSYKDMLATSGYTLFEVHNAHPIVQNQGDAAHHTVEQKWDICLTAGKCLYGIACDDMHQLRSTEPGAAGPGRGWVMVNCDKLEEREILTALEKGEFYSTSGLTLAEVAPEKDRYEVAVDDKENCRIRFIGAHGRILDETIGKKNCYRYQGDEVYVRAKVIRPDGAVAWTQPRFLEDN